MSRARRYRAPFVVTLSVASTLAACGGSTSGDSSGTGGSGGSGNVSGSGGSGNVGGSGGNPAKCPASFPQNETSCDLPSGTSCNYDQGDCCPPWEAQCLNGKWQGFASSCNPPPPMPCPESPPPAGAPCGSREPCSNPYQYCTYGKCMDGSPHTIAQCSGGVWDVQYSNCTLPPCEGLSACDCFDRADCQAVSDSCICPCDYNCPGKPPCVCACGGGNYLGCKAN